MLLNRSLDDIWKMENSLYERELEEVDGFARDLLDVFSEALAPGNVFVGGVARTPTDDTGCFC